MSFGAPPKFIYNYPLDDLSATQFIYLASETIKNLGWKINTVTTGGLIASTKISFSSYGEDISMTIDGDFATLKSRCRGSQLVDWGKNKKNIDLFVATFDIVKSSMSPEQLDEPARIFQTTLAPPQEEKIVAVKKFSFLSIFTPAEGYFITPILIDLNIAVFLLMVLSGVSVMQPTNESLIQWGANFRPITLEGQWWRLLSNFFIHIGLVHLLMNMYALFFIGYLLEPRIGRIRFASAYLLTGIAASVTSLTWHELTISAGASGAIFGMYGVFLAMLTTNLIEKSTRKALLTSIGIFVVYNLANGLNANIDNAAHIGGLSCGLIIGYSFYPSLKNPGAKSLLYRTVAIMAILVLSTCFLALQKTPNDIGKYDEKMKSFYSMESMAMAFYHLPQNTPKAKLLSEIKDSALYYWYENLKLIDELDQLKLPALIHQRDKTLMDYCNLRIRTCNLIYKAVESDDGNSFKDSIAYYNNQINMTVDSLKQE